MDREDVLLWLLEHDSRSNVTLTLDDPVAIAGLPETTGRELDQALQQAVHDGDVEGKLKPYSGIRLWTGLRLTASLPLRARWSSALRASRRSCFRRWESCAASLSRDSNAPVP